MTSRYVFNVLSQSPDLWLSNFAWNAFIIIHAFVSSPFSTGSVPYIVTPGHFQESITSSSHLYHLWACLLLCHRLSCTALYGPVSIPSVLYLAYLPLESHGFFSFDYNKIWGGQRWFSCVHIKQSWDSWLDFYSFLSSLPDLLSHGAIEGVYRKWLWTFITVMSWWNWVPWCKTTQFEGPGRGKAMGPAGTVLLLAAWPSVVGGCHHHCSPSGLSLPGG